MSSADTCAILNRLLILHHRSLPMYLSYAVPWTRPGQEQTAQTLALIVAAQKVMVDRLHEMILSNGGVVEFGRFPLAFTSLHDLSWDYLLQRLVEHQTAAVGEMAACAEALRRVPLAQALAHEALGEGKGHLDALREAAAERSAVEVPQRTV